MDEKQYPDYEASEALEDLEKVFEYVIARKSQKFMVFDFIISDVWHRVKSGYNCNRFVQIVLHWYCDVVYFEDYRSVRSQ